jgi:hypothetical protein
MSALTISQLFLTAVVEIGLGLSALFIAFVLPRIKRQADHKLIFYRTYKTSRNPLIWVVWPYRFSLKEPHEEKKKLDKPMYMKTWVFYYFGCVGFGIMNTVILTFILLTSIGWRLPWLSNWFYNMFYATANGAFNGAHITSYLCVAFTACFVAALKKDIFLGGLAGGLIVSFHELVWLVFYYSAWGQYVVLPGMATNVLKDAIEFVPMLLMITFAFFKYPSNYKFSDFKIPLMLFTAYMIAWLFWPHLIDPSYYGYLPIRTANLPSAYTTVTTTIYNETKYYSDFATNAIEVFSWFILAALMNAVFVLKRNARTEIRKEKEITAITQ